MKITKNLARTLRHCLGNDWRKKVRVMDFRDANFSGADFRGAYFRDADFSGADFRGAYFRDADFRDADFRGANFSGADFRGAYFRYADFRGAYFNNYEKIHLIALANACVYPLKVTLRVLKEAKEKTEAWKQNKTPITRECEYYEACESGWKMAFGSEDYIITDNELHAFWFFCWRAS